jgi:dynein heavy chain
MLIFNFGLQQIDFQLLFFKNNESCYKITKLCSIKFEQSFSSITKYQFTKCLAFEFRPFVHVFAFSIQSFRKEKSDKVDWNVPYDFYNSDVEVLMKLMLIYLTKARINKNPQISWDLFRYLISEAMHKRRLVDQFDRRILITYLDESIGDFFVENSKFSISLLLISSI